MVERTFGFTEMDNAHPLSRESAHFAVLVAERADG
jgi:hypothetical protein